MFRKTYLIIYHDSSQTSLMMLKEIQNSSRFCKKIRRAYVRIWSSVIQYVLLYFLFTSHFSNVNEENSVGRIFSSRDNTQTYI